MDSSSGPGVSSPEVSLEQLRTMAELAGLDMDQQELDEFKPLYDLYRRYIDQLHSIDFGAEEIALSFQPDWTA